MIRLQNHLLGKATTVLLAASMAFSGVPAAAFAADEPDLTADGITVVDIPAETLEDDAELVDDAGTDCQDGEAEEGTNANNDPQSPNGEGAEGGNTSSDDQQSLDNQETPEAAQNEQVADELVTEAEPTQEVLVTEKKNEQKAPALEQEKQEISVQATPSDLLNPAIWLKQQRTGECTLTSAAMMLRRAALLNGRNDWQGITQDSIRSAAWVGGLRWNFSVHGMSVSEEDLSYSNEQVLIGLLEEHPEGVIIYSPAHSVLLTDYTNGILYCADPAYGDRRPLSTAASGCRANNISQYWYVSSDVDGLEPEYFATSCMVAYTTHVQNVGWQQYVEDGLMSGTSGKALRLEGIRVVIGQNLQRWGSIEYCTHVQNIGWQDWVADGDLSGTTGQALRLEAIKIRLTGTLAEKYDVWYRVHCQNIGWMGWAKNGQAAGTAAHAYRLEGIQIVLTPKDASKPAATVAGIKQSTSEAFRQHYIRYRTHVQNDGWQDWTFDGSMSGTSGRALRLEGINIAFSDPLYSGSIQYCTHVQNIGWQDWVSNGKMAGTEGRALRLEGIRIKLTGAMSRQYDVYYRVHCQNIGWMGWAKNGEDAGSAGYSYRLEGIQITLVKKGAEAPGATYEGVEQATDKAFVQR